MDLSEITCPSCYQNFSIAVPPPDELPASLDYDCEVCCRPMCIEINVEGIAEAQGIND